MEEPRNYGHQHPLLLLNEDQLIVADCSMCGVKVSTPCFSCAQDCGFYLHKVCAEPPLELNHPFHPHHPLLLMQNAPYSSGLYICNLCHLKGNKFVYHCSCDLDFHIKCALFTFNISENHLKELEHVALQHPLICPKSGDRELEDGAKCFLCCEPLANYTYFSLDCGFNLHKKCAKLSFKLNHVCHRKHPLVLQFNTEQFSCKICGETSGKGLGFIYGCSPCKFAAHLKCVSAALDLVIGDKRHEHPFSLFPRGSSFICDACGIEGSYASYICCTCNIMVHKKCTSLPRIIKSKWHDHNLFHKYFLRIEDFRVLDCIMCNYEVSTDYGSYYCSECDVILHVKCAMKDKDSYEIVENEDEVPNESSIIVIERNNAGEATKVTHFMHMHNLMLGPFVGGYENSCEGCMLPITDPFYYCTECVFFLHKACAELPKMKNVWRHRCREPLALISYKGIRCEQCRQISNTFAYECSECEGQICLRCVIALTPGARTCLKHEHPLFFYRDYKGQCNACGFTTRWAGGAFCCKDCNFVLHLQCFSLPITVRHKCDEHLLSLTNHDDNSYSENHYCDICEKSRFPDRWFYHCAKCDTSAHVDCVLEKYPFFKLGSIYEETGHPHPLTIVKKKYNYPDCDECSKPCEDVALECSELECKYIVHWNCVAPYPLKWPSRWDM
ncbi:hypothetical protein ERO13_D02G013600v2 [Gossypium hirsutum]|uniref:Zinc finger PHD-type domain-containing protein n=3 Tax=Gossypium TaxID=3633 RepID=A0A1U8MKR6_GOSHI|nr:uncharacterized protein LOC107938704 [Gossypium hirsutum]KAG4156719.1 hypothetical protein ERO13_D02G013600v2 [Gossypium hirsutum]